MMRTHVLASISLGLLLASPLCRADDPPATVPEPSPAIERLIPAHRKMLEASAKDYFVASDGSIWTDKEQRDRDKEPNKEAKAAYDLPDAPLWYSPDLGAVAASEKDVKKILTLRVYAQQIEKLRGALKADELVLLSGVPEGRDDDALHGRFLVIAPAALSIFKTDPDVAALLLAGEEFDGAEAHTRGLGLKTGVLTGYPNDRSLEPCVVRAIKEAAPGKRRRKNRASTTEWQYVEPLAARTGSEVAEVKLTPATPEQLADALDAGRMQGLPNWHPEKYKVKDGKASEAVLSRPRRTGIWTQRSVIGKTKEVAAEYAWRWELKWIPVQFKPTTTPARGDGAGTDPPPPVPGAKADPK